MEVDAFVILIKNFSKHDFNHVCKKFIERFRQVPFKNLINVLRNEAFKSLWASLSHHLKLFQYINPESTDDKELQAADVFLGGLMNSKIRLKYDTNDILFEYFELYTGKEKMKRKIIMEYKMRQYFDTDMLILYVDEKDKKITIKTTLESVFFKLLNYPNTTNFKQCNTNNFIALMPYYIHNREFFLMKIKTLGIKENIPLYIESDNVIRTKGYIDAYFDYISLVCDPIELTDISFLSKILNLDPWLIQYLEENMRISGSIKSPLTWIKMMVQSHLDIYDSAKHKLIWNY